VKVSGIKAGAQLLAKNELSDPMIAFLTYGSGRVMSFTFDTTWHWAFNELTGERATIEVFDRFWRRLALDLVFAGKTSRNIVDVSAEKGLAVPDEELPLTVTVTNMEGLPIEAEVVLIAKTPTGTTTSVPLTRGEGSWTGVFIPKTEGIISFEVIARSGGEITGKDETKVYCLLRDRETADPGTDFALLETVASLTGGSFAIWSDPDPVLVALTQLSESYKTQKRISNPVWASGWLFLLFLFFMTVEWLIRRRQGLP
jgi:hypothetical protein